MGLTSADTATAAGTTGGAPIPVGVAGAGGRMGRTVCAAVAADPRLELVAALDPYAVGEVVEGVEISAQLDSLSACRVVVDFSVADAARTTLAWLAEHGIHAVVGTTGFTPDDLEALRERFVNSNCLVAPNFAISAVLMMRFAEIAAPLFDTAEIIELHHDAKIDAPSGTAVTTAERMASASTDWAPDPTTTTRFDGARGGVGPGGIHIHSVRMRGMVAHQEVILGAEGQSLTIRQDSYDRVSFMPGVVLACKRIHEFPGLTVGLDAFLGI